MKKLKKTFAVGALNVANNERLKVIFFLSRFVIT